MILLPEPLPRLLVYRHPGSILDRRHMSPPVLGGRFSLTAALLCLGFGIGQSPAILLEVPDPYTTIQEAIVASSSGDTVLVAPGTYQENINFRGKNIVVASHYLIDENPVRIDETIIDGGAPTHPDTASCVLITSGEDSTTVLAGFTIQGGKGTRWTDEHGAGVYVEGGGILMQNASPVIHHNHIVDNEAIRRPADGVSAGGGGVRVGDGQPTIHNNIVARNEGMYGGGIVLNFTGATVLNNIIVENHVYEAVPGAPTFGGGGIWCAYNFGDAEKIIDNNTIVGNRVEGQGGVYAGRGGGLLVAATEVRGASNIVWGNSQTIGTQIGAISGGLAAINYSDVEDGWPGAGNISIWPQFTETAYYLSELSACIDAGDPDAAHNDPEDPQVPGKAEWPSLGNLRSDMGAYGGPGRTLLGGIQTSVGETGGGAPALRTTLRFGPNPFNPHTRISFELPRANPVKLEVFDVAGHHVHTLVEATLGAGRHALDWDATGQPSGIYVVRLTRGQETVTGRLLLLK